MSLVARFTITIGACDTAAERGGRVTARITIVGTGLIGTSIGLALKESKVEAEIVGHDREPGRAGEARKLGALDRADWNLPSSLEGAGMVVVATPLASLERIFSQIAEFLAPGCVVVDTSPLKAQPIAWAQASFHGNAFLVGGHPIVDLRPNAAPAATLFQGRTFCLVPSPDAPNEAVDQAIRLVQRLGAIPLFLDAVEHDSHLSLVSALPTVVATALMRLAASSPSWRDGQRLASGHFGSATALALGDANEHRAQFLGNRETLVRWIGLLQEELADLGRAIKDGSEDELLAMVEAAQLARQTWRPGQGPESDVPAADLPRAREHFSSFFLGRLGNRRR
jgi:prephenate dehydrogenase